MIMSRHPNSEQNQNIRTANESFDKLATFIYLGTTLTNQNDIHDEVKSILNSGNACYYSVQNILSSHLISKNLKIKIYKTVICRLYCMGAKLGLSLSGRNTDWGFLRTEWWGGYLDLKGRKMDRGENCMMMSFTACIFQRILLGWLNQGG
jgi:hypothetical protein